ncbi:MAG: hypothetical protein R3271_12800 [Methylophaga sp.]|uniref:hypothetical protein n=1 Tax=Methylophaga sp. TaxID=2024840 RepID=UPI00299E81F6|nr:hypothetical protein [Methylophaga sp.]MDX1751189.1 hypothetical protein [Methylophaga sp.]
MINLEREIRKFKSGERLAFAYGIAGPAFAASVIGMNKLPVSNEYYRLTLSILIDASPWIYITFLFAFLYGKWLSRNSNPIVWKALQAQIDKLQKIAFPNHTNDVNDNHRVTLFKFTRSCNNKCAKRYKKRITKNSGWLVPVIRSGHTGKETKAKFFAPDAGIDAEGIVGMCWSSEYVQYQDNLPNVSSASGQRTKERYCRRSNMPIEMLDEYVKTGKKLACSILAYPVLSRAGDRWGVIVFDSMVPNGVDQQHAELAFYTVAETLGVLVEGV